MGWKVPVLTTLQKVFVKDESFCLVTNEYDGGFFIGSIIRRDAYNEKDWQEMGKVMGWRQKHG